MSYALIWGGVSGLKVLGFPSRGSPWRAPFWRAYLCLICLHNVPTNGIWGVCLLQNCQFFKARRKLSFAILNIAHGVTRKRTVEISQFRYHGRDIAVEISQLRYRSWDITVEISQLSLNCWDITVRISWLTHPSWDIAVKISQLRYREWADQQIEDWIHVRFAHYHVCASICSELDAGCA